MKVCFIGIGSIAKRHIRNLRSLDGDIQIDALRHTKASNEQRPESLNGIIYYTLDELPDDYDVIFITNPTSLHYETLQKVHDKGRHFFIEKPVFMTGAEDVGALKLRRNSVYYVACPLRYTGVLQYIKDSIDSESNYSIRAISSSYLPEWRPGLDYRKTYSAQADLGGGVEIDLIHEWDYLLWLFGIPKRVACMMGKKSGLEISSNDVAIYLAEYADKMLELHLDYFGRQPVRKLQLIGEDDTVEADLVAQRIRWLNSGREMEFLEDRDTYQKKELQSFIDMIQGKKVNTNDIEHAMQTLRIARGIVV